MTEDIHRYHLDGLKETLEAASKSNSNAIIGPKEAKQGAEAIEHFVKQADEGSEVAYRLGYRHATAEEVDAFFAARAARVTAPTDEDIERFCERLKKLGIDDVDLS